MDGWQFLVSMLGGGLAGGALNVSYNRRSYIRKLRTDFHPLVNDLFSAYFLRMEHPDGRYWVQRVGYLAALEDRDFVERRSNFVMTLVKFNELREARKLRKMFAEHPNFRGAAEGETIKIDLAPEYDAISKCLETVQRKLSLS